MLAPGQSRQTESNRTRPVAFRVKSHLPAGGGARSSAALCRILAANVGTPAALWPGRPSAHGASEASVAPHSALCIPHSDLRVHRPGRARQPPHRVDHVGQLQHRPPRLLAGL